VAEVLRTSDMARQRFSELGIKPEMSQITPNEGLLSTPHGHSLAIRRTAGFRIRPEPVIRPV